MKGVATLDTLQDMDSKKAFQPKNLISIGVVVVLLVLSRVLPVPDGLNREGLTAIMIFVSAIVLWIGEAWAMSVTGLLLLFLFPWFNIMTMSECYASFGGTAFTFVLATFGLTATMCTTTIPTRICRSTVIWGGANSKRLILALMIACGTLSAIMSNLAATALFISLIRPIVDAQNKHTGTKKSNLAKCLYIGIPIAANFGGFMTIAGSPSNILVVEMIEQYSNIRVTFLGYMVVGVPFGLLSILTAWFILTKVFKPEAVQQNVIESFQEERTNKTPLTTREKKGLAIIVVTFLCWILSTWIPVLDTTVIAILCMASLMAPGINVLTWEQYNEYSSWDVILLCGVLPALIAGMTKHGAPDWIVKSLFGGLAGLSPFITVLLCSLIFALLRNVIPTAIAFISFMTIPIFGMVETLSLNVVAMMMIVTFWSMVILILPFDPIYMLGYGDGYFTAKDTARSGALTTVVLVVLSAVLIPLLVRLAGY